MLTKLLHFPSPESKASFECVLAYLVVLSGEHLHAHDGEDEPKDEANEQDVEDTGDGLNERVDDDLREFKSY